MYVIIILALHPLPLPWEHRRLSLINLQLQLMPMRVNLLNIAFLDFCYGLLCYSTYSSSLLMLDMCQLTLTFLY